MLKYDNTVSSQVDGKPIYGAQVTVFTADTDTPSPATIFADEAGTTPLSQPILTDQLGYFAFYIGDGKYNIRVMTGAVEISRTNITMVDTLQLKQRALIVPVNEDGGTLPPADQRQGKLLGFDSGGNPTMAVPNSFEGPTGPANSTYDSKAAVAAAPASNKSYLLASSPFDGGYFQDLRGDYRTQVAADPNQVLFIPVAGDPTGAQGVRARVFSGPVDARWAKATGDGVTNDTAAIVAADRVAAAFGKELFIPAGTYMIDPITATTNWRMERGTIIKYRGNGTGYIPLVTFENMTDPVVEGGTFDGNVSADPVNWATGYNTFTGASGLRFLNCTRPKAIRVNAQNCSWSGIQLTGCTNFTIDKCSTKRTRGNFGDGFLIISCVGGVVSDCVSTDYTRIGFVLDSFGEGSGIQTCRDITISGAKATNGHDGSALYGGAEFNVGIWCENSANISVIACFTAQNVHRGINLCTGPMPSRVNGSHASLTVTGCQTEDGSWGILTYSLNNFPVVSVVANCTVKKATLAFEGTAYNPTDAFSWVNCSAEYDASSPVGRGFATEVLAATGKPSFSVGSGCTVTRWQENMALLDAEDGSATTADVGTSITVNGPMRLEIDGLRHKQDKPIYAKWFGNYAHDFLAKNVTLKVPHGGSTGGDIKVEGGEVQSFLTPYGAAPYAATAIIDGSVIVGRVWMRGVKTQVLNATVTLAGSDEVWLEGGTGTRRPTVEVKGSSFTKDLSTAAAGTAVVRVGDGSVDYGALFFANSFYNSGSSDGGRPFIRAAGSIVVSAAANLVDSSVTNIITRADGTSPVTDPTGFTRISMH